MVICFPSKSSFQCGLAFFIRFTSIRDPHRHGHSRTIHRGMPAFSTTNAARQALWHFVIEVYVFNSRVRSASGAGSTCSETPSQSSFWSPRSVQKHLLVSSTPFATVGAEAIRLARCSILADMVRIKAVNDLRGVCVRAHKTGQSVQDWLMAAAAMEVVNVITAGSESVSSGA